MKYSLIVAGGTFDLLHKGHKKFLQDILKLSDKVLLGITSNDYIANFKTSDIEDYEIRKSSVENFLEEIGAKDRVEIVPIDTPYDPLLKTDYNPQAIAVTLETQKTAQELNEKRKSLGLPPFEIEVLKMEKAEDGELISSTRIRGGDINRNGRLYIRNPWLTRDLHLPANLRAILQKPFGEILTSVPENLNKSKIITIGDITTQNFNQVYKEHFLSIVDFTVHREKRFNKLSDLGFSGDIETVTVENPPGSITPDLFNSIQKAFSSKDRKIILVNGEEDLAVLPALLVAPLGFFIFYGQPDKGLVQILVTEKNKEKAYNLMSKFTG